MKNIVIEKMAELPITSLKVEMVERKGLGHPDYITDSIMENFSRELCKYYIKHFGTILHHNVDKGDIVGGATIPEFGGGKVTTPILMFFSGRATAKVGDHVVPLKEIAINSAKNWIKQNMRFLDPEEHVLYNVETKQGSADLQDIFARKEKIPGANDTSVGLGYAPFTPTESLVYETERYINSKQFKKKFPVSGEDVKVMGLRQNGQISLTIAMAMIDRFVKNEDDYFKQKEEILEDLRQFIKNKYDQKVDLFLNTLDKKGRGKAGLFLTVTGTSAEMGDDGQVGRGNRVNGIIAFNRHSSLEATAGKNPVNHVGKLYNILATIISNRIYKEVPGIDEVAVKLLSQIGRPINDPWMARVEILSKNGYDEKHVQRIVEEELDNVTKLTMAIVNGKINLF